MLYLFEDCELDLARVVLRRQGTETRIEPQVFDLLCFLIELRGQFVRKEELLDQVWGDRFVSGSALTTRIKSARQAVGDDGKRQHVIRTLHGKGYEFVADVRVVDGVGVGVESATDASSRTAAAGPIRSGGAACTARPGRPRGAAPITRARDDHHSHGDPGRHRRSREDDRRLRAGPAPWRELPRRELCGLRCRRWLTRTRRARRSRQRSIEDAIVDMLRARRALLVIDNCEHLVEPVAALVGRILGAAPELSILATSREALAVNGEHMWIVEPLDTGTGSDVTGHDLGAVPAVALFVERARAADPMFELNAITAPAVLEICRRLDGIPLAIELAASRARSVDVSEIARRLDERFRMLNGVRRGVDPRHRTLHDAISWSYDLRLSCRKGPPRTLTATNGLASRKSS